MKLTCGPQVGKPCHKQWEVAILILINTSGSIKFRIVKMDNWLNLNKCPCWDSIHDPFLSEANPWTAGLCYPSFSLYWLSFAFSNEENMIGSSRCLSGNVCFRSIHKSMQEASEIFLPNTHCTFHTGLFLVLKKSASRSLHWPFNFVYFNSWQKPRQNVCVTNKSFISSHWANKLLDKQRGHVVCIQCSQCLIVSPFLLNFILTFWWQRGGN